MRREGWTLAIAAAAVAAVATLWLAPPEVAPSGDERDYLRAAIHRAHSGVHSSAPLDAGAPRRDAYREPAYPFLLAAWWRCTGTPPPAAEPDLAPAAWRAVPGVRGLGVLALASAAAAAGAAARGAGAGRRAALAAGALVLASPALRQAALGLGPEAVAAALASLAGCALVWSARGAGAGAVALAGLAAGLGVLVRGAGVALIPAGAIVLLAAPRAGARRVRWARTALFTLLALAPGALWAARNRAATGHWVISDRGGQVMWTRAELNREIAAEGLAPALLGWTPLDAARRLGERRWPAARFSKYEWTGEGNFFTRSLRRWRAERRRTGDGLAADRELGRAALHEFLKRPGDHAVAAVAVAWRGLFAERSPRRLAPVDLTFGLGLASAAGVGLALALGVRRRAAPILALLAVPVALFIFHAALTEFLPRFAVPGLPLAWAACVVAVGGRRG